MRTSGLLHKLHKLYYCINNRIYGIKGGTQRPHNVHKLTTYHWTSLIPVDSTVWLILSPNNFYCYIWCCYMLRGAWCGVVCKLAGEESRTLGFPGWFPLDLPYTCGEWQQPSLLCGPREEWCLQICTWFRFQLQCWSSDSFLESWSGLAGLESDL